MQNELVVTTVVVSHRRIYIPEGVEPSEFKKFLDDSNLDDKLMDFARDLEFAKPENITFQQHTYLQERSTTDGD